MHIEITLVGFFVVLVTLLVLIFCKVEGLLVLAIILAVFQDTSVLNMYAGDKIYPINVFYLPALLFMFRVVLSNFNKCKYPLNERFSVNVPLLLFAIWGVISAFALPTIFEGLYVIPTRPGKIYLLEVLHFSSTNITQVIYLIFYTCFTLVTSNFIKENVYLVNKITKAMIVGFVIIFAFGMWELLSYYYHVPYPAQILHTSLRNISQEWSGQIIGNTRRLTSLFTEPSFLSYYLLGMLLGFLTYLLKTTTFDFLSKKKLYLILNLNFLIILLTTSTTALLSVGVAMFFYVIYCLYGLTHRKVFAIEIVMSIFIGFALIALIIYLINPYFFLNFIDTLQEVTFSKLETVSYFERAGSIKNAFSVFMQTYGLGIGLGSTRPHSLIAYLIASIGVIGVLFFCIFSLSIVRAVKIIKQLSYSQSVADHYLYDKSLIFSGSLLGYLLAGIVANPDLTFPFPWISISILIGMSLSPLARARCRNRISVAT